MRFNAVARTRRATPQAQTFSLNQFHLGLNTVEPASKLVKGEMAECRNFVLNRSRTLQTRFGLSKVTNSAFTTAPTHVYQMPVAGTNYTLAITSAGKLYYLDASDDPALIKDLGTEAELVSYHDYVMIMDGSYLKVWDGSNVSMAYDDGSGSTGCQFDQTTLDQDEDIDLGDGTTERVGVAFDSQEWDSGYTIPITEIQVYLKKTGSPTGDCVAKIRAQADDSVVSTSDTTLDVANLTTTYVLQTFDFPGTDTMDPDTSYYASIEYDNGDGSNYISVAAETVASGGNAVTHDGSSWSTDATANPCARLQPGRPPKAEFGVSYRTRLFLVNPDEPGRLYFSNTNSYLDWSTADAAGWVGVMDSAANSYEVGALVSQFEQLFVLGTETQPYLCVLSGSQPSAYVLSWIMGQIAGTRDTTLSVGNQVFFSNSFGTRSLTGVQEYGDVRTMEASGSIATLFDDDWTSTAFAGWDPQYGLYLLQMPSSPFLLAAHTVLPADRQGATVLPWTQLMFVKYQLNGSSFKWTKSGSGTNEYYVTDSDGNDPSLYEPSFLFLDDRELSSGTAGSLTNLNWDYGDNDTLGFDTIYFRYDGGDPDDQDMQIIMPLTPTAFANWGGTLYMAAEDGHIYSADYGAANDATVQPRYLLKAPYVTGEFNQYSLERAVVLGHSRLGASWSMNLYRDLERITPTVSLSMATGVDEDVTVDELDSVVVDDADFLVTPQPSPAVSQWFNMICYQFQVAIEDLGTRGVPYYLESINIRARRLG